MRTLRIAMYALLALAPIGCGGVSDEGATDENGCPLRAEDWKGTAVLSPPACDGAPETIYVPGIEYTDGTGAMTGFFATTGFDPSKMMCVAAVGAPVPCGRASYILQIPAR